MKKNLVRRSLTLSKETLANLSPRDLRSAQGGAIIGAGTQLECGPNFSKGIGNCPSKTTC